VSQSSQSALPSQLTVRNTEGSVVNQSMANDQPDPIGKSSRKHDSAVSYIGMRSLNKELEPSNIKVDNEASLLAKQELSTLRQDNVELHDLV